MLTVCRQQHSFSTYEWINLWKCKSFWDRKCLDLRGTRTLNLRIHAECPDHLRYQGQTFAVPCFLNTGSGGIDIFEVKLTLEMFTLHGQQHSFSAQEWMFLWKCQSFLDRKCLSWRGIRTPNFWIPAFRYQLCDPNVTDIFQFCHRAQS